MTQPDPQLTAIRLLQDHLTAHNLRGTRVVPLEDGNMRVMWRALSAIDVAGPAPGEDPVAWAEGASRFVLSQIAPYR